MAFTCWFSRLRSASKTIYSHLRYRPSQFQNYTTQNAVVSEFLSPKGRNPFLWWPAYLVPISGASLLLQIEPDTSFCDSSDPNTRCGMPLFLNLYSTATPPQKGPLWDRWVGLGGRGIRGKPLAKLDLNTLNFFLGGGGLLFLGIVCMKCIWLFDYFWWLRNGSIARLCSIMVP